MDGGSGGGRRRSRESRRVNRVRRPERAGGTLLRGIAFFDGAGATAPLAVLAAWVLLGLALSWAAALRRPRPSPVGAPEGDPVAVS